MAIAAQEPTLEPMNEDWQRVLVIVAHPDDIEYGIAAAVAKWTDAGKSVGYVLATRGEAGIAGLPPHLCGPIRAEEERRSAAVVGVETVEFLGLPDGRLQEGLQMRLALAGAIRRHRPDLVVTLNHHDMWMRGHLNSADHRAVGRSVFDAVSDAANEWIFPELMVEDLAPWSGVRAIAVASPQATHAVDVTGFVERAVASLAEHRRYLEVLSDVPVEQQAREQIVRATAPKPGTGDRPAVAFELFELG